MLNTNSDREGLMDQSAEVKKLKFTRDGISLDRYISGKSIWVVLSSICAWA